MKPNAPEKIFLEWYEIGDKKYRDWCIIPRTNDESVEYTRTDTFLEKAEEYIYEQLNEGCIECGDIERFIEGMKNYMKGE